MTKKQYLYGEVDYTSLVQARNTLEKIFQAAHSEAEKMGTRNITVHAYRKEVLDDLFANTAKEFLQDLDYLLTQLEKQAPNYAPTKK
ncbi:16481_t:CDS:2 [Entrophospora sp. SA101]|nr:99_t:CDS:2 [Entrophospora sp. SA101]CAJ0761231.1 16481_t:CDS:2 [Entrophospora sp. SA101]CAJ0912293.1 9082_t:CDS:2 [Entrophospora sp. SA101]